FFLFQAEDGIRVFQVTGVQTCALPISLPAAGGGEPTAAELREPVGEYESSLHLLRDTIIAAGAPLLVALGNVGMRSIVTAARLDEDERIVTQNWLVKRGAERDIVIALERLDPDAAF